MKAWVQAWRPPSGEGPGPSFEKEATVVGSPRSSFDVRSSLAFVLVAVEEGSVCFPSSAPCELLSFDLSGIRLS